MFPLSCSPAELLLLMTAYSCPPDVTSCSTFPPGGQLWVNIRLAGCSTSSSFSIDLSLVVLLAAATSPSFSSSMDGSSLFIVQSLLSEQNEDVSSLRPGEDTFSLSATSVDAISVDVASVGVVSASAGWVSGVGCVVAEVPIAAYSYRCSSERLLRNS